MKVGYRSDEECGYHFGSLEAAKKRLVDKTLDDTDLRFEFIKSVNRLPLSAFRHKLQKYLDRRDIDPSIYVVNLGVNNMLRMEEFERFGTWKPDEILSKLFDPFSKHHVPLEVSGITEDEIEGFLDFVDEMDSPFSILGDMSNREKCDWIGQYLADKGFDGIVYDNRFEGGGDSYIIFDPNRIHIENIISVDKEMLIEEIGQMYGSIC